ncbi:helix-turn-helix domain-containing protein [Streptomyces boluensis]|uniref:helix-turn-helix domain-containing protein n=1 Tax=Streptomyces boluensis TaxID=1775135 RepID=UPI0028B204AD|nr:helix-turn-helix transcriptional regulator [Streptomyces boluensis]
MLLDIGPAQRPQVPLTRGQLGRTRARLQMSKVSTGVVLNERLESAMADARMTPQRLARRIGVSPKTVKRWLDDEAQPHRQSRVDAARHWE